ncbi:TPA: hypothetical protein DCP77_04090 [Candidatus Collierbacteria bacterium]|uniref:Uncharacterized protein n=1 Tax=Candidatus Collierbacteria bacterium GW2011_GWA2_42_17 TaxID=1618378 RepID=A0A0G1C0R5_9BACT|nr:MAG: hypothetical protein UU94_C0008G0023 [Candidatus Collierbacteria bacterium GW2011_GWB2_42_12]KKS43228.1 MAG: hypothetical protein UV06_C0002G0130 [Candidatus Collierbacteria bacterium GW2011_GWA2_42_17]HAI22780.1 hypothetical protein [Candidatus Collierbacteria bacterium]HAN22925.1 hypothetical protein [Candidatus Collierbacteria bacterium]HBX64181.1 hypothetical protein [Candidatus Collierbacteria bacterium]
MDEETKISVTGNAINLWYQVLRGPVAVPEWELRCADIQELLNSGLVKIVDSTFPVKFVELCNPSMAMSINEQKLLTLLKTYKSGPVTVGLLRAWSGELRVERPLKTIKKLFDLRLVEFSDKEKKQVQACFGCR